MKDGLDIDLIGNKRWYLNNQLHREDGPAQEFGAYSEESYKAYFLYNKCHRDGKPAREWANGGKEYYQHGQLHRDDGPAVEHPENHKEWYLHGKKLNCETQEEFERLMKLKAFW